MFCPKCGTKLEKDASFCPECGEKIERSPTELFPKKQVHKSRFKRITFSCNNKWDYIWIAVFIVLVVVAGSKMVSSVVKASYNITYADNSSYHHMRKMKYLQKEKIIRTVVLLKNGEVMLSKM